MNKPKAKKIFNITTEIIFRTGGIGTFCTLFIGMIIYSTLIYDFRLLTMTTYVTIMLVSMAYACNLNKPFLNSIATVAWFIFPFVDLTGHLTLSIFQLIIIFSRKKISKEGILFGFLFYLAFMFTFDNVNRVMNQILIIVPGDLFRSGVFYFLVFSTGIAYFTKKKRGLVIDC